MGEGRGPAVVWTVAGFDPSSGAGVTADLMVFGAHGLFGCSAITAMTVQSTLGVLGVQPLQPQQLRETLDCLWADLPPKGIKIGMLGSREIADALGSFLLRLRSSERAGCPVVLDPVLCSSSGRPLYPQEGIAELHRNVVAYADWITPNWAELGALTERPVGRLAEAEQAARALVLRHPRLGVLVTGGDQERPLDMVVQAGEETVILEGDRVHTTSTHGTGCAFSSALLAYLVRGSGPVAAARSAKQFVAEALRSAPGLGSGKGPMNLLWPLAGRQTPGAG